MTRPRVAYLALTTKFGGATTSLALALEALPAGQVEKRVFLAQLHPGEMERRYRAATEGLEVVAIAELNHNRQYGRRSRWQVRRAIRGSRTGCRELARRLEATGTEVLHVNTTVFAHALGPLKEALPRLKIVVHAREELEPDDPIGGWMLREIHRAADAVVAISDAEARVHQAHPRVRVLPNPMPLPALGPGMDAPFRREHGLAADVQLVGMFAQFVREKGQLEFLRALAALLARGFDPTKVRFVAVGWRSFPRWKELLKRWLRPGSYTQEIRRCIEEHHLAPSLIIVPGTERPAEVMAAMDVVVRPSLGGDPWGRDVIEAMAFARPVVATGSSPFYVREGETGFLVPPRDPVVMAERIERLLRDPDLRGAMGERGRDRVAELCDPARHAAGLLALYRELLA